MAFTENLLNLFANLDLALIDLFFLEILLSLFFHIDKAGNVKVTLDWLFGISKIRVTEFFVFPFILFGLIIFFISNFFQGKITLFLVGYFGYSLIFLFLGLLTFVIFYVSFVIVGRDIKFRLCLPYLIFSAIFFMIVIIWKLVS